MADPAISLVVGLGNPGARYEGTRHNAGFWLVEAWARRQGECFRPEAKFHGEIASVQGPRGRVWLLKPSTFMNRSGLAIGALAKFYKLAPEQVLVVHDELDLPPGTVRLKRGGGHGGHNGLRDTIAHLSSNDFWRVRLGIGHPGHRDLVLNYVLDAPGRSDRQAIEDAAADVLEAADLILDGEMDRAFQRLHTRSRGTEPGTESGAADTGS